MVADQEEIHRLSLSKYEEDKILAVRLLEQEFVSLPDKSAAWNDLIILINDRHLQVSIDASKALVYAFQFIPEESKSANWNKLAWSLNEWDTDIRRSIDYAIGSTFRYIPEEYKSAAWDVLHKFLINDFLILRGDAAYSLSFAFPFIPEENKSTALDDILRLVFDRTQTDGNHIYYKYLNIDYVARLTLVSGFQFISDEKKFSTWNSLIQRTSDKNKLVRSRAFEIIVSLFQYIPKEHKSEAWEDLHSLTNDQDTKVISNVAYALGSVFEYIPEKYKSDTWNDLVRLTSCINSDVKMNSNHSLGKICIYKASKSENENEARKQLEKAIGYFEIAYSISSVLNPANFCYPFYYSFNEVLFKKVSSKEKIKNYINAAKKECVYSRKKQKLIEAIEQLAEALEIAHDAYESGGDWQETLKYCSDICNHAEQLMNENKDKTPTIFALYEKTKPSFEETIKKLIDNIRKKIEIGREKAVGTPYESIYDDAEKEAKRWLTDTDDEILSIIEKIPPDKIKFINNELNKTIEEIDPKRRLIIVLKIMREISLYVNDPMKVEVSQDVINDLLLRVARLETNTNQIREATNETTTRFEKNINDEIKELNKKVDIVVKGNICIENKVDNGFENLNQKADLLIFIELKKIASKLKEEGNEKGSQEVNNIADKIKVLLENNDPKEIIIFIEKLREKVPTLLEEIDKSNAPKDVKENAKKGLKENIMKFGRDISTGVAINWIATYLPSIIGAGASGFLALGIIFGALLSIDNLRDQGKK